MEYITIYELYINHTYESNRVLCFIWQNCWQNLGNAFHRLDLELDSIPLIQSTNGIIKENN